MKLVSKSEVSVPDWGWHYESTATTSKLSASIQRFGQINPLLVRQTEEGYELVDGRRRYDLLPDKVWIHDLGPITREEAIKHALALEVMGDVDYVSLAECVMGLQEDQDFRSLPAFTPWTDERIEYFSTLLRFDWSQFDEAQVSLLTDDSESIRFTAPEDPSDVPAPESVRIVPTVDRAALRSSVRENAPDRPTRDVRRADGTVSTPVDPSEGRPVRVDVGPAPLTDAPADHTWRAEPPPCLDRYTDIEIDCETAGLRWWEGDRVVGYAIGYGDRRQYLPIRHTGGNLDIDVVHEWFRREVRGKTITNANSRFDNHMIYGEGIDLEGQGCVWADVQHYAALLDEYRRDFHLQTLGMDFLGEGKVDGLDKSRMADYHANQVAEYACQDVALVHKLNEIMLPKLREQDLERVRKLECDVIYLVCEMERNAAYIDTTALQDAVTRSGSILQEMVFQISRETGFSMSPSKDADIIKLLEILGIPIKGRTEKGKVSVRDEIISKIDNKTVQMARKARKIANIRSKFLLPYAKLVTEDSRLRFALHQLRGDQYGTVRGRFSMSGGDKTIGKFGANLQQVVRVNSQRESFGFHHKDSSHDHEIFLVRSFFVPQEGIFLSADAQSIEYRLAAHFANSRKLIEAYQADWEKLKDEEGVRNGKYEGQWVDFHNTVGDFVRPYKDLSRNIIKNLNFCKIYGGGRDTVAKTLGMERAESDQVVSVYDRTFPEFAGLLRKAERIAKGRGFVKTILGRRARFPGSMRRFAHAALNYVIQGSAADILKVKGVELHKARKHTGLLLRLTVHDEFDGDARKKETVPRVREILNQQTVMQYINGEPRPLKVPIVWEVGSGRNWADAH